MVMTKDKNFKQIKDEELDRLKRRADIQKYKADYYFNLYRRMVFLALPFILIGAILLQIPFFRRLLEVVLPWI